MVKKMNNAQIVIEAIIAALQDGGYDPFDQLCGFLKTGDETFITRRNGARNKVKSVNKVDLANYISENAPGKRHRQLGKDWLINHTD